MSIILKKILESLILKGLKGLFNFIWDTLSLKRYNKKVDKKVEDFKNADTKKDRADSFSNLP
jgi:hypothetical protein